jgi:N-carbamoyl-L-amino-acid hydrolase
MSRPVLDVGALHGMLAEQAAIGATPEGGLHRVSASAEDGRVRDWLTDWFRAHELRPLVDSVGNQFGLLELAGPDAPLLLTGSHLDSQPQAGRFDGAYGVVASCQAVAAIQAAVAAGAPRPRCNLGVVNWTNEEGARFQPSLLGSSVYAGTLSAAAAGELTDRDGVRLDEALDAIGYRRGDAAPPASAYVELHVECGPELEAAGRRIGVVESWWGAVKATVEMVGRQAHTGPTAMRDRRDALYAAALLIVAVRRGPLRVGGARRGEPELAERRTRPGPAVGRAALAARRRARAGACAAGFGGRAGGRSRGGPRPRGGGVGPSGGQVRPRAGGAGRRGGAAAGPRAAAPGDRRGA